MLCEPLAMASVFQSLAISEAARSSVGYGARIPCSSPFHQRPSYLKLRDLHFSSHNNSLIFLSSDNLCFSVTTTAEATEQVLDASAQDGAQEALDMASLVSSSNATKTPSMPIRYAHLTELVSQLCAGADVPSAMDPWLQKLTLSDWNQLLIQCGRKDCDIAKQILVLFTEKEYVLDQEVLFSKKSEEQASASSTDELSRELDSDVAESSQEALEDAVEKPEESSLQEHQEEPQDGVDLVGGNTLSEVEQNFSNFSPSLKLYTTLTRVLTKKRRFDDIDALELDVKEAGLELNVHYYNVLLDSHIERRSFPKAMEILHHMKSLGFEPHISFHEKLACTYMYGGDVDLKVLKELAEDLKRRNSAVNITLSKNLLKAHWEASDVAGAEEAFEVLMAAGHTPDMKDLLKIMQLNGRRGNHERVTELVELMVKLGYKPNASVYDFLVHAYCKAGLMEKAKETFLKFESVLGTKPTTIAINMLIDGYGKQALHEEALKMFQEIRTFGYWPSPVSYSCIISAMAQVGKFKSAAQLYEKMLKSATQPNLHTYLTLIRSYTKCNQTREGHKIYNSMRKSRHKMSGTAYSVSLALYVSGTWYHHAAALLKEIEEEGVVLEAVACSSVVRSFSTLQSNTTPLARAVQESKMEICKLLTSLFEATAENKKLESSLVDSVFSVLEEWKGIASLEAKALIYNSFIDYFWMKGYQEIAKDILNFGRGVYAGYSRPRLSGAEWVLDVRGLGVAGAKVALKDWLFSEQEMLEDKGVDDVKMIVITGDEFSLSLPQDNSMVKSVITSMLTDLGSPFVESSNSSEKLEASLADVLIWVSEMKLNRPPGLF